MGIQADTSQLGSLLPSSPICETATYELRQHAHHQETLHAVQEALKLAQKGPATADLVADLGGGWVAEEALAIAIFVVASTDSLPNALLAAVNHSGDSDSTGAITGNIAGMLYEEHAIPHAWLDQLELRGVITEIADDLHRCWRAEDWDPEREWERYPGW